MIKKISSIIIERLFFDYSLTDRTVYTFSLEILIYKAIYLLFTLIMMLFNHKYLESIFFIYLDYN